MVSFKVKVKGQPKGIGILQWLAIKAFLSRIGVPETMFTKVWDFLNGKKTVVGSIITALGVAATYLLPVLSFFGVDPAHVAVAVGVVTSVVGILHKVYKFIYKEELP